MASKTKRVKFIQTLGTASNCFIKDHEYEIPADEADQFVKEGNAVAIKASKKGAAKADAEDAQDEDTTPGSEE